jgi:hypothetical protein
MQITFDIEKSYDVWRRMFSRHFPHIARKKKKLYLDEKATPDRNLVKNIIENRIPRNSTK